MRVAGIWASISRTLGWQPFFPLGRGHLVLITGASSGVGAATARLLSRDGATVLLVARSEAPLAELATLIKAEGGTVYTYAVDCGDSEQVTAMAEQVRKRHGVPDVIVNSAGLGAWKNIFDTTPSDVAHCMTAPYYAAANVVLAFIHSMAQRKSPTIIVNINSPVAYLPWPGCASYAACRGALRLFHESLKMDLASTKVIPVEVVLGLVKSNYFAANNVDPASQLPKICCIIPQLTEEDAAKAVRKAIWRGKSVTHPWQLNAVLFFHRLFPSVTSWLMKITYYPQK